MNNTTNRKNTLVSLLATAGLVLALFADEPPDLTSAVEYVADPSYARYKGVVPDASTLYDLQVYHDRIFSGNGDWGSNNGPLHVVAVEPNLKTAVDECIIGTEAAETLRVLSDGDLYVPATDECERDASHGLFFQRNAAGEWQAHTRQIVDKNVCMHFWDMMDLGNRLFLAGFGIASSADGGTTWSRVDILDPDPDDPPYWPFRGFIKCGNELFCRNEIKIPFDETTGQVRKDPYSGDRSYYWRWNAETSGFDTVWNGDFRELYEGVTGGDFAICSQIFSPDRLSLTVGIWHSTPFKDRSLYVLCESRTRGMYPVAAITAWVENYRLRGRRVTLGTGEYPIDITVFGDAVYMLTIKYRSGEQNVEHAVWKSTDGENFTKILTLRFQQVLSSLEYHNGYFYFGTAFLDYQPYFGTLAAKTDLAGRIYRARCPQEPVQVVSTVSTNEVVEGSSVRIGYRLSAAPKSNVTLSVVQSNGNPNFTVSPSTLTFTPADWNVEQDVVVSLGDIKTGDYSAAAITCGVATPDSVRGAFASPDVTASSVALTPVRRDDEVKSPYAVGGRVSVVETADYKRYVHVFTNTAGVVRFRNKSSQALNGRILVVGAGGAGGFGLAGAAGGGGGGGGGGVCEQMITIPSGARWNVLVGKGARASTSTVSNRGVAGASSISNGMSCVVLVPGGGNGGEKESASTAKTPFYPTEGAAGGGGNRYCGDAKGTNGTYRSSLFGATYGPFPGGNASYDSSWVGGGGGAGAAGVKRNGGEGLASDITGISLVYGSGGGGGGSLNQPTTSTVRHAPGLGGTRAGQGAEGNYFSSDPTFTPPVPPERNSGCGGSGGLGGENISGWPKGEARYGASGADGIVVIAYEIHKVPLAGGEVTKIAEQGKKATYIHVFTNANAAATLENLVGVDVPVRVLVVGAGGAGGFGLIDASGSGGGGGGGGVYEAANVTMPAGGHWTVGVGAGAKATASTDRIRNETAGCSFISNATECVALVPGGGNGGESSSANNFNKGHPPTDGAGGGGGVRAQSAGGAGTYQSSVLGVTYGPFEGGRIGSYNCGGGGGGASAAGSYQAGGEGLASDITGVSLVYGSGGGGGAVWTSATSKAPYGHGGTRAGDGASATVQDDVATTTAATKPVANSGGGGAGGLGGTIFRPSTATSNPGYGVNANLRYGTSGADGIVVIRYEWEYDSDPAAGALILIR